MHKLFFKVNFGATFRIPPTSTEPPQEGNVDGGGRAHLDALHCLTVKPNLLPTLVFFAFSCLVFSELPESVLWYLTLIYRNLRYYYSNISSLSFSPSSPGIPITHMCNFCICLVVLGYTLFWDFFSLCFPCFLIFEDSIDTSSSSEIFPHPCPVYPKLIKSTLHFCFSILHL